MQKRADPFLCHKNYSNARLIGTYRLIGQNVLIKTLY